MTLLTRFDPFYELTSELFNGFNAAGMKVDVAEKNGDYLVKAELPGVKKDDIHVSIDGAEVTLEAEVKREKEASKDERVLHAERVYGKLSRSFTLPLEVDEAKAEARFRDGVLELTLPRKAAAAHKQITIQ
jgi:HSP20 family protein